MVIMKRMKLKPLRTDENAVSPVIGVILIVAITVVLAAVIASFALGLEAEQEAAPTISFSFEYDENAAGGNSALTIEVKSGTEVRNDRVHVTATETICQGDDNASCSGSTEIPLTATHDNDGSITSETWIAGDLGAGSTFSLSGASSTLDDATIRIVAATTEGNEDNIIGEWEGPTV
jgi:flagellin-like protein